MVRTLFLVTAAICMCGCQSYQTRLDLPETFERVEIRPIANNNQLDNNMIAHSLIDELSQNFTITDNQPDITILVSGDVQYDPMGIPYVNYCLLTIETPDGPTSTIKSTVGSLVCDGLKRFAKKIKKILTKRR